MLAHAFPGGLCWLEALGAVQKASELDSRSNLVELNLHDPLLYSSLELLRGLDDLSIPAGKEVSLSG